MRFGSSRVSRSIAASQTSTAAVAASTRLQPDAPFVATTPTAVQAAMADVVAVRVGRSGAGRVSTEVVSFIATNIAE